MKYARAQYHEVSYLFRLKVLKEIYWVFNRGGTDAITAFEVCNNLCLIFLVSYSYILAYQLDWSKVVGNGEWRTAPFCTSLLCRSLTLMNALVTFVVLTWGTVASFQRVKKAQKIHVDVMRKLGKWPTEWYELLEYYHPLWDLRNRLEASIRQSLESQVAAYLCSESIQTRLVFKIMGIEPHSWYVSRYFAWAIQSSLSITRSGVMTEDSNVNLELYVHVVDKETSRRQIVLTTLLLLFTSPFFFAYYSARIIIQEFHKYKSGNRMDGYTWSVGTQFALKRKTELPHEFKQRLQLIQSKVEKLKRSRRGSVLSTSFFTLLHFMFTCFLVTCIIMSAVAIEDGTWNEKLGVLTALLSAAVMYGVASDVKIDAKEAGRLEREITAEFGVPATTVELYLCSRGIHILKEISGIIFTPMLLVTKMLPRISEISVAIEMDCAFQEDPLHEMHEMHESRPEFFYDGEQQKQTTVEDNHTRRPFFSIHQ
jgi:hypothetical protein